VLFDGDCMIEAERLRGYFREEDGALLEESKRVGENLCYVIAVVGQGTCTHEEISRRLRSAKVLGYMGMTCPARFERDEFLRFGKLMALCIALRIDGAKLKKIDYNFQSVEELRQIGFQPFAEE